MIPPDSMLRVCRASNKTIFYELVDKATDKYLSDLDIDQSRLNSLYNWASVVGRFEKSEKRFSASAFGETDAQIQWTSGD